MGAVAHLFDVDFRRTVGPLRNGQGDPTTVIGASDLWRASTTPDGPATVHLWQRSDGTLDAEAWGPGRDWALARAGDLAGAHDEPGGFVPPDRRLAELQRRHPGLRIGRTHRVLDHLVPAILHQRVTTGEAGRSWAAIVRRFGTPAPGPHPGLWAPPEADRLAAVPYHVFHRFNVERHRADTIRRVCRHAGRLEEAVAMAPADAHRRLQAVDGVGVWTSNVVLRVAIGDPDAVAVGDAHLPHTVAWFLAGEARATDERMLELLAPFAGHRARAVTLIQLAGHGAPRFGPGIRLVPIARL